MSSLSDPPQAPSAVALTATARPPTTRRQVDARTATTSAKAERRREMSTRTRSKRRSTDPAPSSAAGPSGELDESGTAEAQEKMDKLRQCVRDAGFDFPGVELGEGPTTALHKLDRSDPDF